MKLSSSEPSLKKQFNIKNAYSPPGAEWHERINFTLMFAVFVFYSTMNVCNKVIKSGDMATSLAGTPVPKHTRREPLMSE